MKKVFLFFPLLILLAAGSTGCGLFHDDSEEDYWEEAESAPANTYGESAEMQEKIEELAQTVDDSEAKVTILKDEVEDIQHRIDREKEEIGELKSQIRNYESGGGESSTEKKDLERQIKILENDVKWLKWIQKNY